LIFLGIIIAALAATGAVAAVTEGVNHHSAVTLTVFGKALPTTSTAGVFLVGAATACVFLLGCSLAASGFRRSARVRRELRDLRDEHDENLQALAAEKAQLERQLARERRMAGHTVPPGPPTGAGVTAARPYPGADTDPAAGRSLPGMPAGPPFAGPAGPPNPLTAPSFRHRER
jgi:hypothetical protein